MILNMKPDNTARFQLTVKNIRLYRIYYTVILLITFDLPGQHYTSAASPVIHTCKYQYKKSIGD